MCNGVGWPMWHLMDTCSLIHQCYYTLNWKETLVTQWIWKQILIRTGKYHFIGQTLQGSFFTTVETSPKNQDSFLRHAYAETKETKFQAQTRQCKNKTDASSVNKCY